MSKLVVLPRPIVEIPEDRIIVDELVADGFYNLPTYEIRISRTNRKRFDVDGLERLANNIKDVGILQPILLRPVKPTDDEPQHFEIVAGERRFRAAVMAELRNVPAIIRSLSDSQAAEIQLLENVQRENPHPLEEAEGYQLLMLNHSYTADQLADKVNKSRAYIYARLKLCALSLEARETFLDNEEQFSASLALLVARIPVPALQNRALQEILSPPLNNGEPMSYRRAAAHITARYTLDLDDAPFDTKDAKLMASAGSCVKCPKLTGNQPVIFADAKSPNVCTDPDCFAEKSAAHYQRITVVANKRGTPIIEGTEATRIRSTAWTNSGEFVLLNTHLSSFQRVAPGTGMSGDVEEHLDSAALPAPAKYIKNADGTLDAVYRRDEVQVALEKAGACETVAARKAREAKEAENPAEAPKVSKQHEAKLKEQEERERRQREADAKTRARVTLYRKVRAHGANGLSTAMIRELAKVLVRHPHYNFSLPDDLIGDLYSFKRSDDDVCAHIDQASSNEIMLLIMDLIVGEDLGVSTFDLEDDEVPEAYAAIQKIAELEGINVTPADLAIASFKVGALNNPDDVLAAIEANIEHIDQVAAYIVDKAPHHTGNVEAAANSLGYFYAKGRWKEKEVAQPAPAADAQPQESVAATPAAPLKPAAKKSPAKPKAKAATKAAAAAAAAETDSTNQPEQPKALPPAAAWPFPTSHRPN